MKRICLLLLCLLWTIPAIEATEREFRGAWLHVVGNTRYRTMTGEQIRKEFRQTLDRLKAAGCNAVIFQVRPQADAFYPSDLEPWSRFLTGKQGVAPDPLWDPLAFMITEAHSRGMELHAWCNPYRVTSNDREKLTPAHLYFRRPEIFVRYGTQLYLDPGEPEARAHTVRVVADLVRRYDIDGIHFDDYFYPYPVRFEEFHDDRSFVRYAAEQGFEYWQKNDWRRHNVELLIRELNDTIKSIKPWVRFGISPFGIHRNKRDWPDGSETNGLSNYDQLFADVPGWARKGYIDYIVPQLYWAIGHPAADYETLIHWWNDGNFTPHLYIGQNIEVMDRPDPERPGETQLGRKIGLTRELEHVAGNVWWSGWALAADNKGVRSELEQNYQREPALIPAYRQLDSIPPAAPVGLHRTGKHLRWKNPRTEDPMQQVLFNAVYIRENTAETAGEPVCLDIVAGEQFTLPETLRKKKGTEIRITAVDRCWNESTAVSIVL